MAEMTNTELIRYARKSMPPVIAKMGDTHLTIRSSKNGQYLTVHNQHQHYLIKVGNWVSVDELNLFHKDGSRNYAVSMPMVSAAEFRKTYPNAIWIVEVPYDTMTAHQRKNLEVMREQVWKLIDEWGVTPICKLQCAGTTSEAWIIWDPREYVKGSGKPHMLIRDGGEIVMND